MLALVLRPGDAKGGGAWKVEADMEAEAEAEAELALALALALVWARA